MLKFIEFFLGQASGEYFVTTGEPGPGKPSFFFVRRTRQDAIDLACSGIATWLRSVAKTPPKSKIEVSGVSKYVAPVPAPTCCERPVKKKKFGGLPIRVRIPSEVITVRVEV